MIHQRGSNLLNFFGTLQTCSTGIRATDKSSECVNPIIVFLGMLKKMSVLMPPMTVRISAAMSQDVRGGDHELDGTADATQQRLRTGRARPAGRQRAWSPRRVPEQAKMPPGRTWLWFVLVLLANYLLVRLLMPSAEGPVTVPYTLFKEEVGKSNVEAIYSQGDTITGRFKAPVTYPPAGEKGAAPSGEPRPDERARCSAPRRPAQNGEYLHDDAALLRRPRFGSIFDRQRG